MNNIKDYIRLSDAADNISWSFTEPSNLIKHHLNVHSSERQSLIRHFVINNIPYVFRSKPLLYEQIIQYLSDRLEIAAEQVKIVGSAKTGFSMSSPPHYGIPFGSHSDIDFAIISSSLFNSMKSEYQTWAEMYIDKIMFPNTIGEEKFWPDNILSGRQQISQGFIDTVFVPNRTPFVLTRRIHSCMFLIKRNLESMYEIKISKASVRIFENWNSFNKRVNFSFFRVMDKNLGT